MMRNMRRLPVSRCDPPSTLTRIFWHLMGRCIRCGSFDVVKTSKSKRGYYMCAACNHIVDINKRRIKFK